MDKVAIYCRLSEEDRDKLNKTDDSESIKNQKSMLLKYAMQQGWEVYNIYSDDDYAGADRKRPEFNRLLHDAEEGKFDIVLCKTQSRFTRELELVEKYIHGLFPLWGIRFVGLVDNADTDNKGNKKARQINGLVNEWYLEDMSDSIKSSLTIRRQNGHHIGAFALYGYMKDPNQKGHLIIDEKAAEVVRKVFTLFSQGMGKTAIARLLNEKKIPNPTEYKHLEGLRYKQPDSTNSTLWKYSAISSMLTNEMYIGNMVQGKYGSEFCFVVNGVKIFAMGANYIPQDNLLSRISRERTKRLLEDCVEANFNCIRVWGGGYYPEDDFYDLCDEMGLLVWQDFMVACANVWLTERFENSMVREAIYNIKRVRNHASLGILCGNNEVEAALLGWDIAKDSELAKHDYLRLYEHILPELVDEYAPHTFYWPSSPSCGGGFHDPGNKLNGDVHYWNVWHGNEPFTDYRRHLFRFCSEYGFESFPLLRPYAPSVRRRI